VLDGKNALGEKKYPILDKIVKACLALPHGNSDVERSFSQNKKTVTVDRCNLNEDTINALRFVKESIRVAGGSPVDIPLTNELLISTRCALSNTE